MMATTVLNAASTSTNIKSFEKSTSDLYGDTIRSARDIGQARLNYSRLNMITTLSEKETDDWFSFKVTSRGKLRLTAVNVTAVQDEKKTTDSKESSASDELENAVSDYEKAIERFKGQGLKVEVYQYVQNRQTLVATNEEGQGKKTEAFEQLMRGEYKVQKAGTYYIHVTTKDGKPVDRDTLYALQVQLGDKYTHDYITKETAVDHTKATEAELRQAKAESESSYSGSSFVNGKTLAAQGAANLLATGYTNMATMNKNRSSAAKLFSLLV